MDGIAINRMFYSLCQCYSNVSEFYKCSEAHCGRKGVERIEENRIWLVISNISLSIEFQKHLKNDRYHTEIKGCHAECRRQACLLSPCNRRLRQLPK